MSLPSAVRVFHGIARILAALLRLLRRIPKFDEAIDRIQRVLLNPVVVRLVQDPADPDLDKALQLYEKRIPDYQAFEPSDIIRWLRDDLEGRKLKSAPSTDWFLVAKYRRQLGGFMLFHYFPKHRLAFVAYMVVANTPGAPPNAVSANLCGTVSRLLRTRKELRGCARLILEVEDPRKEKSAKKQDECLARVRRFCTLAEMQGLSMRALDIDYVQPKLSLGDSVSVERPLLLMSARTWQAKVSAEIDRMEVEQILSFIYTDLYPEGYSTDPRENTAYREYCSGLRDRTISSLPSPIRSQSCAELVSQVRNMRHKKSHAH